MVETDVIDGDPVRVALEVQCEIHHRTDRNVAQSDDTRQTHPMQGFRNQSGRIGEVYNPGIGAVVLDISCDFLHHRNGAQGFGEPADTGGFLADQAVSVTEF